MKETDPKTRAGTIGPEVDALSTGEQLSLELQSESEHQIGTKREKMIFEAKDAAGGVKEDARGVKGKGQPGRAGL